MEKKEKPPQTPPKKTEIYRVPSPLPDVLAWIRDPSPSAQDDKGFRFLMKTEGGVGDNPPAADFPHKDCVYRALFLSRPPMSTQYVLRDKVQRHIRREAGGAVGAGEA